MDFPHRSALALVLLAMSIANVAFAQAEPPRIKRFTSDSAVELSSGTSTTPVKRGERFGPWTLMEVVQGERPYAILEDFQRQDGRILFVDGTGVRLELAKSLEPSNVDSKSLYLGLSRAQIEASETDILAERILVASGDPDFNTVASVFPPLQNIASGTFTFIGTPDTSEKIGFAYGGRTSYFDPAVYEPSIRRIRDARTVSHGLVGGYLPVLRFVYPDADGSWTELLAFAPFRIINDNTRVQAVWYRVTRVERGGVAWSRYIDSYQLFPPRAADDARTFYSDLAMLKARWDDLLQPGMQIDIPDARLSNLTRHSLIRAMMTRVGDAPKYGAVDKNYGGNEHDGFPDTFTVDTAAMIEWGLLERAGRYIDNYFGAYVRDDGSILYRGPETGQFGRMLTVLAQYANAGGSRDLLLRHRKRIDAITQVLLAMRARALTLPAADPAYGMLAGWSEADSALDPEPARYMQPYFSNSTEAARGFRDLGKVWETIGVQNGDESLVAWGRKLIDEARALRHDIDTSIGKSTLGIDGRSVLPAIAGVAEPFHVVVQRDRLDPQHRSYRAYMEMMHSGSLPAGKVRNIVDYRANHRDVLLGIPTAYGFGTREVAGFLLYGHVYGLIQHDMIREALLATYSDVAHQYTRGMWTAPETRRPLLEEDAAPYCSPAQLVAPLLIRWLLIFEDPESDILWLGKGMPREWLEHGKRASVTGATTKWGRIGFSITSTLQRRSISAHIDLPANGLNAETRLRLRVPDATPIKSVTLNGRRWTQFEAAGEYVVIPARTGGPIDINVRY